MNPPSILCKHPSISEKLKIAAAIAGKTNPFSTIYASHDRRSFQPSPNSLRIKASRAWSC